MSRIAAIVLAAGLSSRMGGQNKLLADLNGTPVVVRALQAIANSYVQKVIVVTGHDADKVAELIQEFNLTIVRNSEFALGMAGSIRAGVGAVPANIDGLMICLGDMPAVSGDAINRLIAAFEKCGKDAICVPEFEGKTGQPVLFGRKYIAQLARLSGDTGARSVITSNPGAVVHVQMPDEGVLLDADTGENLVFLRRFLG